VKGGGPSDNLSLQDISYLDLLRIGSLTVEKYTVQSSGAGRRRNPGATVPEGYCYSAPYNGAADSDLFECLKHHLASPFLWILYNASGEIKHAR
jgi:hypothetical protein